MSSDGTASPSRTPEHALEDGALNLASMKRQIAHLEKELQQQQEQTSGRKKSVAVTALGRGASRLVSMFKPLSALVGEADDRLNPMNVDPDRTEADQQEHDRDFKSYQLLIALIPNLEKLLADDDTDKSAAYVAVLQKGANEARADDIRRVKEEVALWLNETYNPAVAFSPKTRDGRGIQNDITGRLLCPIAFDWDDESVRTKIRNCEEGFDIYDDFCITALYPKLLFSVIDPEHGFLRSALLVKTYCVIFTAPSSAEEFQEETDADGPIRKKSKSATWAKANKSNVATLLRMNGRVTPRSIAYAATLEIGMFELFLYLLFNLSNAVQWPVKSAFDYHAFYNFIIDYFEVFTDAESKKHTDELLAWWNKSIFPNHTMSKATADAVWKRLVAARAERSKARARARAQAVAAAGNSGRTV